MINSFRALAEPRRIEILKLLLDAERPAGEIAAQFDVTRTAISQHLGVLKDAGLISETRDGTKRIYAVRSEGFEDIREFLEQFWSKSFDRLEEMIEEETKSIN